MPSSETLSKAKNVTIIFSIAMLFLLVLYTFYIRLMKSNNLLLILVYFIIAGVILILYCRTSDPTPQAPLFSFPSLSTQNHSRLFSFPSFSSHETQFENSDISLRGHVNMERPQLEKDDLRIDWEATSEWGSFHRREAFERASAVSGEEVIKMVVHEQPHMDQGNIGDESMDDTWRSIVARGEAKPVSLFKSKKSLEKVHDMNESATLKRKGKKKKKEREASYEEVTSGSRQRDIYEIKEPTTPRRKEKSKKKEGETSLEKEINGWRQNDAIMMSNAEISRLSDLLIKSQYNRLKIERQESDQRRLVLV